MSECRWAGLGNPRLTKDHLEDCDQDGCPGCLPCPRAHCRVCGKEHNAGTCPACVGEARDDLNAIGQMCGKLRFEATHRGINSEAMALAAPAADPEAWGHITTSLKVGRLPANYLQCDRCNNSWPCTNPKHADSELHPLFVLGTWEQVWRDALDHETDALITIPEAVRYLGLQLTYMASYEHAPFEDFAHDLRKCRAHLEAVLHDQNYGDMANVGCFDCGGDLERLLTETGFDDRWTCRTCKRKYSYAEYNFALRAKLEDAATQESA